MRLSPIYVLLMQNRKVSMVKGDNSSFMRRGEIQLLRISCLYETDFQRRRHVKSIFA